MGGVATDFDVDVSAGKAGLSLELLNDLNLQFF